MITVYRYVGGVKTQVEQLPKKGAVYVNGIMGVDELQINVTVSEVLNIKENDFIEYNSVEYTLNRDSDYKQKSEVELRYSFIFEHPIYKLLDKIYTHKKTGLHTFHLTGKLKDFIDLLVWNVNKTTGNPLGVDTGWTRGYIINTKYKNIYFEKLSCREVLKKLSKEFFCEYYANGKELNFVNRIETPTPYVLTQGEGNGLYEIDEQNVDREDTITRVYVRGGNKNVPNDNADAEGYLRLPEKYLENFSEHKKAVEKVVTFEEIFPHFEGTVSSVTGENNISFSCRRINFNLKEIAVGNNARINFLSGDLTGKSFEFKWDNNTKKITLISQEDDASLEENGEKPSIPHPSKKVNNGDVFNFTGVTMPYQYVDTAITELRAEGNRWLNFYSKKRKKYTAKIDHRFMRNKTPLKCGDLVVVVIPKKSISSTIRIVSQKIKLGSGEITVTISNYLEDDYKNFDEDRVSRLRDYVIYKNGDTKKVLSQIFRDEIVSASEISVLKGIQNSYISEKGRMNAQYLVVRGNNDLVNKTPLQQAWSIYVSAYSELEALLSAIIKKRNATEEELNEIDTRIQNYDLKIQELQHTIEVAKNDILLENNKKLNNLLELNKRELQKQIDNEISSYAYPYKPTLSNYPAVEWTTEELKLRHDKDVFFNNKSFVDNASTPDAGKAWRWSKIGGVWKWNQIADSDTVKALKEASKAQAMADGKSTLFGFTPNVVRADGFCYRQGDSWILNADRIINGTAYKQGEILTATQDSAVFNEAHWLKRVRYTDDSAVEELEIGGVNLLNNTYSGAVKYTTKTNAPLLIPNSTIVAFEAGKNYILSFSFKCDTSNAISSANYCYLLAADGKGNRNLGHGAVVSDGQWQRVVIPFKFKENRKGRVAIGFDSRQPTVAGNTDFYIKEEQLEKSTKATDYKPSLADQKKEIDLAKQLGVDAQKAADAVKQSANSYTLFAKDKHFREHNWNEYIEDTDAQGGMALRTWRGWSSLLYFKTQLNFLKIGCKYRIYLRAKIKGDTAANGVSFGWYRGINTNFSVGDKLSTSYKTIDAGIFSASWEVSKNPYLWFLQTHSFANNDGSDGSGLYIDWIRFVEADVEDIADKKIADAKKEALKATGAVDKELKELKTKTQKFEKEVNGAFKDNIISEAEARSIEKYKNTVATEKSDVDAQYDKIYADENLEGIAKTNLAARKTALNTAYSNLVSAISTAIADWKTTPAEKTNVDTNFSTYRTALGNLRKAFEEAIKAIEDKKIADAEAKIESLKNDLDPTKQQADYLAKALKQDSEVQGGLVLGSVIAVRGADGKVTAYMSGDRALNVAAFKAGVEFFGTQGEKHNIALNHEGTADLGVLRVEKEGDVRVYDLDTKEERFGIIKKNIQSLSELQSASVFNLSDTGNPVNLSNSEEKFIQDLSLFIPKVGGVLDVEGKMSITVVWDTSSADNSDFVRSQISLELYRDGVSQGSIWSYADIAVSGKDSFAKNVNIKESITAEKGFYTVKVKASILHSSGYSEVLVSLSSPKLTWKLEAQNYRKINIGLDGLFATYPDKLLYFSAQQGLVVGGSTDMPGLLATGSSSQYGSVSNLWGAKASGNGSHKISQGKFRVYHNIGHSNYTISVMCHSVGVVATVGTKASSYFEFYMQKNGSYYDSGFDYVVYGRNF